MALPRQSSNKLWNLDYDKIFVQKVQLLPTIFYGDVLVELLPLFLNNHSSFKNARMDKKDDGHAWCKVITTNIKNSFRLSFKKTHYLGCLCCVQDDCENFVHSIFTNETRNLLVWWECSYSSHKLDATNSVHFLSWMQILSCSSPPHHWVIVGESIMLSINFNLYQEWWFILGYTTFLLRMASVRSL